MNHSGKNHMATTALIGSSILAIILVVGTLWLGHHARQDTEAAVRSVSLLYLDELAGRREQVVENNLSEKIQTIRIAIDLMTDEDISNKTNMEAYQSRMKQLYKLDKFAFVDTDGLIYTSTGTQSNIAEYGFDYQTLSAPEISIYDPEGAGRHVIIAVPTDIPFQGKTLCVCFMAIDMDEMLSGVSMSTNSGDATFCNLYTKDGAALTNAVLGGLAEEDNLLDAMRIAAFEQPYTYADFMQQFRSGKRGVVSFTYNGIRETLTYIPVSGTDWQLTYLIRESVISNRISSISRGTVRRSILQSVLTVTAMLVMFGLIIGQAKRNNRLLLEHETTAVESRVKQEALEQQLALQEQLLAEERQREQQDKMITALAADDWSVYYLDLDNDTGVCYQAHTDLDKPGLQVGEQFAYLSAFTAYANQYITEQYREEFLRFIQPDALRSELKTRRVISCTYMVRRHGKETYETMRFARVRRAGELNDQTVHSVGACFVDVDAETRRSMDQQQALNDALTAAEDASRAKTAFLSNMSHEIRTPMNAIIGLDSLALRDETLPQATKEYLEKIGESAKHLLGLINDILDMSRIESGRIVIRREEFSFRAMLEQINTMVMAQCTEKGLKYECRVTGGISDYYIGDDMKLKQVLINILSNAIKFTEAPGSVTLAVEKVASYEDQTTIKFVITDTGIGMDPSFLPKIFDTFAQEHSDNKNKYGSTGLGMAITKNIVEIMNGTISVSSTKGEGTEFVVNITLKDCEHQRLATSYIDPSDMYVLVVDDEEVAAEHARLVLDEVGIRTDIAVSGQEALDMLEIRHTKHDPYNLVLLDWKMPDMDGIETAKRIRELYDNETTIIILTSFNWDEIMDEALHVGVDSFLAKPLFASNVIDEFDRIARKNNMTLYKEKKRADLAGRKILIAEDVEINAEIMKELLSIREMQADHAINGKVVVEMFAASEEGYYDAILMDVRMPELDGLEATKKIRHLSREDASKIPIIAMTANAFDEDVQRSLQVGMNAHLSKPVEPDRLYQTMEELIWEYRFH